MEKKNSNLAPQRGFVYRDYRIEPEIRRLVGDGGDQAEPTTQEYPPPPSPYRFRLAAPLAPLVPFLFWPR